MNYFLVKVEHYFGIPAKFLVEAENTNEAFDISCRIVKRNDNWKNVKSMKKIPPTKLKKYEHLSLYDKNKVKGW